MEIKYSKYITVIMTLWRRVIVMTIRSLGHDTLTTTRKHIFSMFSRHSEAFASECLENLEKIYLRVVISLPGTRCIMMS